jgi:hypothetical protein
VIERDQALTGKMPGSRTARSSDRPGRSQRSARGRPPGFSTVRNLALGVKGGTRSAAGSEEPPRGLGARVAVACAAKMLASRSARGPDEAFTAGLLHDVGRLVLAMRFGTTTGRASAAGRGGREHRGLEREAWESTMPRSAADPRGLGLPPGIVEVRGHHATSAAPASPASWR